MLTLAAVYGTVCELTENNYITNIVNFQTTEGIPMAKVHLVVSRTIAYDIDHEPIGDCSPDEVRRYLENVAKERFSDELRDGDLDGGWKISISVEKPEPEPEPTVIVSYADVSPVWDKFCQLTGTNPWGRNEGIISITDKFQITLEQAKELGL